MGVTTNVGGDAASVRKTSQVSVSTAGEMGGRKISAVSMSAQAPAGGSVSTNNIVSSGMATADLGVLSSAGQYSKTVTTTTTTTTGSGMTSTALPAMAGSLSTSGGEKVVNTMAGASSMMTSGPSSSNILMGKTGYVSNGQSVASTLAPCNAQGSAQMNTMTTSYQGPAYYTSSNQYTSNNNYQEGSRSVSVRGTYEEAARESTKVVSSYLDYANQKVTENVVRREVGEMRVISVTQRVDESRAHIVSERFVEHEVRVPKKIVREDIVERTVVVPEKVIVEEIVNDVCKVKEKIVEYARPTIVEKVIEVPEYEYVEKIVEVPEKIVEERVKHVDKVVYEDRVQEKIKIIPQERIVEKPEIQYREVPVERVVEVEEWRDEIKIKEIPVPQYVEKPVPQVVEVESAVDVARNIPVCVESELTTEVRVAEIKPRYKKMSYPVYLPKFIEVPVALELLGQQLQGESSAFLSQINGLTKTAASLCDIENLASNIMKADHNAIAVDLNNSSKLQSLIMDAWTSGNMGSVVASGNIVASGNVMAAQQSSQQYSYSQQRVSTTTTYAPTTTTAAPVAC